MDFPQLLNDFRHLVAERSWLLFVAIAVLPGCGFPVSILFTLAGIIWGTSFQSCMLVIGALAINLTWTYWLARSPLGSILRSRFPERWRGFLDTITDNGTQAILVLRLTPGMPLFIQNYALGILGVRFTQYLPLSLLLSSLWACAFVVSGGAIFHGNIGYAITGLSVFVIAIIVTRFLRRYSAKKS